jgi:hypothetical protein
MRGTGAYINLSEKKGGRKSDEKGSGIWKGSRNMPLGEESGSRGTMQEII